MCELALVVGVKVKVAVLVSVALTAKVVGVVNGLRTVELLVTDWVVKEAASFPARSWIALASLPAVGSL